LARGELELAREHFSQARRLHAERQSPRELVEAELHLAEVELAAGNPGRATERAVAATKQGAVLNAADLDAQCAMLQGRCALAREAPAEAEPLLERAVALCARSWSTAGLATCGSSRTC
jgi:hypothetical protein